MLQTGRVFVTGRYDDAEVADLLRREQPDVIWLPSLCLETWSYTLTHALRSRLPIVAFDLGAIGERLRGQSLATLLPLDTNPNTLNNLFLTLAARARATPPDGAAGILATPALERSAVSPQTSNR